MIHAVQCYPKKVVADFIKTLDNIDKPVIRWALISVTSDKPLLTDEVKEVIKNHNCVASLGFQFDDVTKEECDRIPENTPDKWKLKLMTDDEAKQIVKLVEDVHKSDERVKLFCSCDAGISRSGAIGTWATDYCKHDWELFKRNNPNIHPNQYVLQLLKRWSGMSY